MGQDQAIGADWEQRGGFAVRTEPPDIVHVRSLGDVTGEDMAWLLEGLRKHAREGDRFFMIDDVSRLGHIAIDARKQLATLRLRGRVRAVAFVGGSFEQRVMASLSYNASKLVPALQSAPPFRFFDTAAEARLWLAELREAPEARL